MPPGHEELTFCIDIVEPHADAVQIESRLAAVLGRYCQNLLDRTKLHIGYPANMDLETGGLGELLHFSINNIGDPFIGSNYGLNSNKFEVSVLDWFARLWQLAKDEYWGYVTNGGTEGNLHGLLMGREVLPDGILYTSEESHYSVFKAARMCRMECIKVKTLVSGEMDCSDLKAKLLSNKDKPAIMNINIGTTMKGAIDDLDHVIRILEVCGFSQNRFYIHCDAALFGLMLPFVDGAPLITFKKPIGSVSISGHKFLGCPMPCGVQITRSSYINSLSEDVEFIFSRDATISGSRNGHVPIFLWYSLNRKGYKGLHKVVHECLQIAVYLKEKLRESGISAMLNKLSNTVVFERPRDEELIRKWQLCCQGKLAHVIVMPNVTIEVLDAFLSELVQKRLIWFKKEPSNPQCFASELGDENCACPLHNSALVEVRLQLQKSSLNSAVTSLLKSKMDSLGQLKSC